MKMKLVVKKYDAWYRISSVFIWRYLGGKWLYWKWNYFLSWLYIKSLEWLGFTKYHMKFDFISGSWASINPAHNTETYSEPCQISKMELFAQIGNGLKLLTSFTRSSIFDVYHGSEYASVIRSDKISNNSETHTTYAFLA